MISPNPLAWENSFPPVYGHTSVSFLKHCPGFHEAKHGDLNAALAVADKCVNRKTVSALRKSFPDAVLLPVIARNKLPEALAITLGMKICTEVHECKTLSRKTLSGMERLLHKPTFNGRLVRGKSYIIVDDVITQGGTAAELRKYIIAQGGTVAAMVTLSYSAGSGILVPAENDIFNLANRFSLNSITNTLKRYDIACDPQELTRAQLKYILLFKELERLVKKIELAQTSIGAYKS